uniref:Coiled-coil domain containing 88Aa n=1 Tax=Sinocyclocheilus anshuiensis TaxID=1608454 RepID=A0A671K8P8_9TELE
TLHQLIMMPSPNVLLLGRNPVCEEGLEEIRKLLLLLLGCAVQCERKEECIEKIQSLDFDTKAAIAAHIQEVTHCQENVFDLHWLGIDGLCPEEWENLCRSMSINLKILVDQRDWQFEVSSEEKSEQLLDCRQDLDSVEAEVKRHQQENMQLLTDARAARMYRDELDAMKERAIRADKLESEVARYRDKLHNMNFYKVKLEELKEDNQVLMESKAMLEEELQKSKLHDMEEETTVDRRRIEELLERNVILELSQKRSMEESKRLGWELELSKSLGQEVTEMTCSRLLKLEKENQRLLKALEELQGNSRPLDEIISESKHIEENGRTDIVDYKTHKSTPAFTNMHNGRIITPNQKTSNHSLDTEHLHIYLENTNTNLLCLEVEVHELETENQSHQVNFNQNQGQVDIENQGLVHENGDLEQDRSCLEKENRRLWQQVKIQEVSLDSSNLKLVVLEKENHTLVKKANYLSEACAKNKELEKENQELIQQTGVDKRMLMTLREVTTTVKALNWTYLPLVFLVQDATLQAEKQALQTQLQTLQMQSDGLQTQIIALQQQTASLQESNTTLQTHNAQLQVSQIKPDILY